MANISPVYVPLYKWDPPSFIPFYPPLSGDKQSMFIQKCGDIPRSMLPDPVPNVYKSMEIQYFCLFVLTKINKSIYSEDMLRKIQYNVAIETDFITSIDYIYKNIFAFYLKGGNVLPFLDLASGQYQMMPYNFTGDFDCTALVNPNFDPIIFRTIREIIIVEILNVYKSIILKPVLWEKIFKELCKYNVQCEFLESKKIELHQEALTPDDMGLYQNVYSKDFENWKSPDGCPFQIEIHPNLPYIHTPQNMTILKLKLRTIPPINLIDISIPSLSNKYLQFEWDIHSGIPFDDQHYKLSFYFSNYINTYIDYRLSALLDTRHTKRAKRTQRADRLRNNIINPMLRSGKLRMSSITRLKEKRYNPELGIDMNEILGNLNN